MKAGVGRLGYVNLSILLLFLCWWWFPLLLFHMLVHEFLPLREFPSLPGYSLFLFFVDFPPLSLLIQQPLCAVVLLSVRGLER